MSSFKSENVTQGAGIVPDEVNHQRGTMVKDPRNMTEAERLEWQRDCFDEARAYLFSIDQPLVYRQADGRMIAEYKDGNKVVVS